jgi:hypothetical protein
MIINRSLEFRKKKTCWLRFIGPKACIYSKINFKFGCSQLCSLEGCKMSLQDSLYAKMTRFNKSQSLENMHYSLYTDHHFCHLCVAQNAKYSTSRFCNIVVQTIEYYQTFFWIILKYHLQFFLKKGPRPPFRLSDILPPIDNKCRWFYNNLVQEYFVVAYTKTVYII